MSGVVGSIGSKSGNFALGAIVNHEAAKNSWHTALAASVDQSSNAVFDFGTNIFIGTNITEAGGRMTCRLAGIYWVSYHMSNRDFVANDIDMAIRVNADEVDGTRGYQNMVSSVTAGYSGQTVSAPIHVPAGGIVDIEGNGNVYGAGENERMTFFMGVRIGAMEIY